MTTKSKSYDATEQGEVEIVKRGDELVLHPISKQNAGVLFDLLSSFEGAFERPDIRLETRD